MLVPVYLDLADGAVTLLGRTRMTGNNNTDQKVPLKGLKTKPRKAILNGCDDVLASPN